MVNPLVIKVNFLHDTSMKISHFIVLWIDFQNQPGHERLIVFFFILKI